ncbi:peptidoglycan -binding protein [Hwanghaeella sp. LZ110]|mgnify:FL=1|uniref:peptidoglycan -binding protein n=1 Tax=Hwanghaeella sp. LZ110 TaxID=3402810 RepID=UPI003B681B7D
MAYARRQRANLDIWPGFVDALASLLMVIIFLLMIFVVSQFYLNEEIIGRDKALDRLQNRVSELADMLALERESSAEIRTNLSNVTEQLRASLQRQDALESQIFQLRGENASLASELDAVNNNNRDLLSRLAVKNDETAAVQKDLNEARTRLEALESEREQVSKELEDAYKIIDADKEKIQTQLSDLAKLEREVEALISLRDELQGRLANEALKLDDKQKDLVAARAETALLNDQIQALNDQIAELNKLLEVSEARDAAQQSQIVDLGKRLNVALAGKVQELARYRSEFFGKLREILGNRSDIRIVGDRFVFQSEVLFEQGQAELGPAGQVQLISFADTLKEIAARIPSDIDWVLQVNGHTDKIPIRTAQFPSNWELSTARAISVVKFLESRGIDPNRMSAAGFAQYQPLDTGNSDEALRRNRRIEMKFTNR